MDVENYNMLPYMLKKVRQDRVILGWVCVTLG
jgi:hypothetical protein